MKRLALLALLLSACHPDEQRWNTEPNDAMVSTVWLLAFHRVDVGPKVKFVVPGGCFHRGDWIEDAFISGNDGCVWGIYRQEVDTAEVSTLRANTTIPHELMHAYKLRTTGDADPGHDGWTDPFDIRDFWMRATLGPAEEMMLAMLQGK